MALKGLQCPLDQSGAWGWLSQGFVLPASHRPASLCGDEGFPRSKDKGLRPDLRTYTMLLLLHSVVLNKLQGHTESVHLWIKDAVKLNCKDKCVLGGEKFATIKQSITPTRPSMQFFPLAGGSSPRILSHLSPSNQGRKL